MFEENDMDTRVRELCDTVLSPNRAMVILSKSGLFDEKAREVLTTCFLHPLPLGCKAVISVIWDIEWMPKCEDRGILYRPDIAAALG